MARSKARADRGLESGWEALRTGNWVAARACFADATARCATAEAFEGLSWAAWWLDDSETVFAARERAFQLYRKARDGASAARMATWLAADQLDFFGAVAVASGWLGRARRLLEPLEPGPDHGWLAFHEAYVANLRGEIKRAEQLSARAQTIGRDCDVPDLEMLGLALQGSILVARARVAEGMRCLDEATAIALEGEARIPISSAWACCFLLSACTKVLDYERAFEWCDRIAEFAQRFGSRYMLGYCRAEYATVHVWRGAWDAAESALTASIEDLGRSRAAWVQSPTVTLADLRRRQGRASESARLLEAAGTSSAAQLCRARAALDRDEPGAAAAIIARVLRQIPAGCKLDRAPALDLLVQAKIRAGELDAARPLLDELRVIARATGTEAILALVERDEGLLAAGASDHERAQTLLEDALDRFDRCGAAFEAASIRIDLAATLAARGRAAAATREIEAALARLATLGAEAEARRARKVQRGIATRGGTPRLAITQRERDVLRLVVRGLTNPRIARELGVSEHTVHRHVANILRKLGVPSRAAAAAHAVRAGLVGGA